jgi:apolipoprotein D and lipocalin family protein
MRHHHLALVSTLLLGMVAAGCAGDHPLKPVPNVDVDRFMGTWHVIGYVPNVFERGKVATADEYRRRPDGAIDNIYHYRKRFDAPEKTWHGKAWIPDPAQPGHWKIQLLWPFRSDYVIVDLAADYGSVLVGIPSRKLVWIMARGTSLSAAEYERLVGVARANGFPVENIRKAAQRPEDVGKPGFE